MRVQRDFRTDTVTITMSMEEFQDHVEWLELIGTGDGCMEDFRAELDRIALEDDDPA